MLVFVGENPLGIEILGHRKRRLLACKPFEGIGHLAFKMQARIEDDVRRVHPRHLVGGDFVAMRVGVAAHELVHFDVLAADVAHDVRDHADGADHLDRAGSLMCLRDGKFAAAVGRGLVVAVTTGEGCGK